MEKNREPCPSCPSSQTHTHSPSCACVHARMLTLSLSVVVSYPAHYSDVMDLFRAVLQRNELSPRTLLLSEAVIDVNSANYSAWHFRRLCLEALHSDLSAELEWVAGVARDTPKNYQLWHHRRTLLERLADCSPKRAFNELSLTAEVLQADAKNYHAWSHRQWCLHFFARPTPAEVAAAAADENRDGAVELPVHANVFAAELVFVDGLLKDDVRNNSAWNQRFFVRTHAPRSAEAAKHAAPAGSRGHPFSASMLSEEIAYTGSKLALAPHNESPWNYLEGLMRNQRAWGAGHRRALLQLVANLPGMPAEAGADLPDQASDAELSDRAALLPNRFAQSVLLELWLSASAGHAAEPQRAKAAAERLAKDLDPVRAKYWMWRAQQIEEQSAAAAKDGAAAASSPAAGAAK